MSFCFKRKKNRWQLKVINGESDRKVLYKLLLSRAKKFVKEATHFSVNGKLQTRVVGEIFFKRNKKPFKYYIRTGMGGSEIVNFCLQTVHRVSGLENQKKNSRQKYQVENRKKSSSSQFFFQV